MRLARRRLVDDDGLLLAAARSGDEDALALLRCGLRADQLARARDVLRVRDPGALRAALRAQRDSVLDDLLDGVGPAARAELLGQPVVRPCRAAALHSGARTEGERAAAAAHAATCRACRGS